MKRRILFLVPSDYDDLMRKGVASLTRERDEGGFFERVVTVHPWANQSRILDISPDHRLYEMHETFWPFLGRFKLFRYPQHLFHFIRLVAAVVKIIDQEEISILRATDPFYTGLIGWAATRLRSIPFCISVHSDYHKRFELDGSRGAPTLLGSRAAARLLERFTLMRADIVMPIRPSLARMVRNYGVPENRICVIPHGIDLNSYSGSSSENVRSTLQIPDGIQLLSFVGRLCRENYVLDLLELAAALKKVRSDFIIVIAGEGTEKSAMADIIRDKGLAEVVKLIGFRSHDFVIALRKQSVVSLCLMGGYSLIEACAAGSPAIAYDVEWHSELIESGKTGWLIKEHDVAALVNKVNELLDHPEEGRAMGSAARAITMDRHDIQKTSAVKRQYYEVLISMAANRQ